MICVEWPWAADHFGLGLMYVECRSIHFSHYSVFRKKHPLQD